MDEHQTDHGKVEQNEEIKTTDTVSASATPAAMEHTIKGVVLEETKTGSFKPLTGASIMWLGTNMGTVTDSTGFFN
ncbi:MAG: hypothetical protein WKG06_05190 [Segetibacter sp.]